MQLKIHSSPLLKPSPNQALVLLNTEWTLHDQLWNESKYRVCADGAANRLYSTRQDVCPDLICGDLDSITKEVREFYESKDVPCVRDYDQDRNDIDKCLERVQHYDRVVIFGAFGGRFDQEMASFQALFAWRKIPELWLIDHQNIAILLEPGFENRITVGKDKMCGLIPLGGPCKSVTTQGFRWNLNDQPTEFGGLVSTSNYIEEHSVTVTCSDPLIFTATIN